MKPFLGPEEPATSPALRRVLVIDADPAARRMIGQALAAVATCTEAGDMDRAFAVLDRGDPDLIVLCLDDGASTAPDTIETIRFAGYEGPILATSARISLATAVEAMRCGASDVAGKPVSAADLSRRVSKLLERERPAVRALPSSRRETADFEGFVGASPVMRDIYEQIRRIAPSKAPVFVTGESGTGKEVTAQAIHTRSGRPAERFVALNCGAIPKDLIESEIFGHVKGAFTGATDDRTGAAELADGGTLFLDEICEMDLALQTKLLRFIQTGEVRRVGDTRIRRVDVRFVCATNRDPLADVAAGRFREDLYYRLCVLPVHLAAAASFDEVQRAEADVARAGVAAVVGAHRIAAAEAGHPEAGREGEGRAVRCHRPATVDRDDGEPHPGREAVVEHDLGAGRRARPRRLATALRLGEGRSGEQNGDGQRRSPGLEGPDHIPV